VRVLTEHEAGSCHRALSVAGGIVEKHSPVGVERRRAPSNDGAFDGGRSVTSAAAARTRLVFSSERKTMRFRVASTPVAYLSTSSSEELILIALDNTDVLSEGVEATRTRRGEPPHLVRAWIS